MRHALSMSFHVGCLSPKRLIVQRLPQYKIITLVCDGLLRFLVNDHPQHNVLLQTSFKYLFTQTVRDASMLLSGVAGLWRFPNLA